MLFANEDKLTAFVNAGGFLWFGAAAFGFQDGDLDGAVLPGGLTVHGPDYQDQNTVEAPTHPLMAGMPDPFNGTSASHVTFGDLPAGSTVIAATPSGDPTLVDYDLGKGHIVAVGQPVEWGFANGEDTALILENGVPFAENYYPVADVPWLSETPVEGTIGPDGSVDITVSVDATGVEPGVYSVSVLIRTNDPDHDKLIVPVTLIVPAYQQGINAGGKQYVAPDGTVYAADQEYKPAGPGGPGGHTTTFGYLKGGGTNKTNKAIEGTDEDVRYQTQREDTDGYRFEVADGIYKVDLSFAEFTANKVGNRVFAIDLEGNEVVPALDVFKQSGGKFIAYDLSFVVEVSDGVLDLDFLMPKGHKSIVNSILVTQLPPGAPGHLIDNGSSSGGGHVPSTTTVPTIPYASCPGRWQMYWYVPGVVNVTVVVRVAPAGIVTSVGCDRGPVPCRSGGAGARRRPRRSIRDRWGRRSGART